MKKHTRVLALIGAVLLIALYACTLIFALIGTPWANDLFKASVAATILIPVILYAYLMFYRLSNRNQDNSSDE